MSFGTCPACRAPDFAEVYAGRVRDGAYGRFREDARVGRCRGCGVERLDETACLSDEHYESNEYRTRLEQSTLAAEQHALHDSLQSHHLELVLPKKPRDKRIIDVGSGAGTFVDHVRGLSSTVAVVEPMREFREDLARRGYAAFASNADAAAAGRYDIVTCFQVIEHVSDAFGFLRELGALLAPGGELVLTTPNRDDVLRGLIGREFDEFFYRTVHRWYFDAESLEKWAKAANLTDVRVRGLHRLGMANAFGWLRDRRPPGRAPHPLLDASADAFWKHYLEGRGAADTLVLEARAA